MGERIQLKGLQVTCIHARVHMHMHACTGLHAYMGERIQLKGLQVSARLPGHMRTHMHMPPMHPCASMPHMGTCTHVPDQSRFSHTSSHVVLLTSYF